MKVFVAGGTGFIGTHFLKNIAYDDNFEKIGICVNKRKPRIRSEKFEIYEGCRIDSESLFQVDGNYDYVVDFVGIIKETRDKKFENVHHRGVVNLIELAKRVGAVGFVYVSAAGVEKGIDAAYMRTKFLAEQEIVGSGLEYLILRPSFVLGPDGDFVKMLKKMIKFLPFIPVIGDGNYRVQPVFVGDLVEAIRRGILEGVRGIYGACGPDRVTYNEFIMIVKKALGSKKPIFHIPVGFMRLSAKLLGPLSPANEDQLKMLFAGSTCEEADIFSKVGLSPKPLQEIVKLSLPVPIEH